MGFGESQPKLRVTQMLKRLNLLWLVLGQALSFERIVKVQNLQALLLPPDCRDVRISLSDSSLNLVQYVCCNPWKKYDHLL